MAANTLLDIAMKGLFDCIQALAAEFEKRAVDHTNHIHAAMDQDPRFTVSDLSLREYRECLGYTGA